ncbi:MAG: 50S ribosomal protein L31 [Candidatus Gracilibacteria bacterium]|jgi:large subunit ribosomal protein L31|nr:50S ribosomal protein L31 [Candidatus Gracilibacteria bacterium]
MKKGIHPEMSSTKFVCSCGNVVESLSTLKDTEYRVEICSACHPFYTGEQRILKTGAVDKFYARQKKFEAMKKAQK